MANKPQISRIAEDQNALSVLKNKKQYYFDFLDAIYRKNDLGENIINVEPDFIKPFTPKQSQNIIAELSSFLNPKLAKSQNASLYLPLAMGNHPDHKVLRIAIDFNYHASFPTFNYIISQTFLIPFELKIKW